MLLSIAERILLGAVLPPAEGDFLFLRAVRALREDLSFSEEEAAATGLKREPDGSGVRVVWDTGNTLMKEITIGPVAAAYLSKSILAAKGLKEEHLDLYMKFVEAEA